MALSYRARRRWAFAILLIGLPIYIVAAVTIMDALRAHFGRPVWALEVLVFVALGVIWALPFRSVFKGIGRDDPDAPKPPQK